MISREVTIKKSFDTGSSATLNHRPISQFVGIATKYTDCRIWILNEDRRLNAKSYLGICSLGISMEKIRTLASAFRAEFMATFSAKAVLPIDGRAAMRIRSEGCRPVVCLSRSAKPVARPATTP